MLVSLGFLLPDGWVASEVSFLILLLYFFPLLWYIFNSGEFVKSECSRYNFLIKSKDKVIIC